jgi:hypothetical protein
LLVEPLAARETALSGDVAQFLGLDAVQRIAASEEAGHVVEGGVAGGRMSRNAERSVRGDLFDPTTRERVESAVTDRVNRPRPA